MALHGLRIAGLFFFFCTAAPLGCQVLESLTKIHCWIVATPSSKGLPGGDCEPDCEKLHELCC